MSSIPARNIINLNEQPADHKCVISQGDSVKTCKT